MIKSQRVYFVIEDTWNGVRGMQGTRRVHSTLDSDLAFELARKRQCDAEKVYGDRSPYSYRVESDLLLERVMCDYFLSE